MSFILLLEDELLQVKLLTDMLKYQLGLSVKATDSLEQALLLAKENPVLIISDICLVKPNNRPAIFNQDGILFSQTVKTNPETCHIPLILRSSMPLANFGITFEDTKADIFLNKSISSTEFLKIVKSFVHGAADFDTISRSKPE